MSRRKNHLAVFAALLVVFVLASCRVEPAREGRQKPDAVVDAEGEAKAALEPPPDWSKKIPLYPRAELKKIERLPGSGLTLRFVSEDPAYMIFNWYYDTLEAARWRMEGPTLDVARNVAIIRGRLGEETSLLFNARAPDDQTGGSVISLTSPAP